MAEAIAKFAAAVTTSGEMSASEACAFAEDTYRQLLICGFSEGEAVEFLEDEVLQYVPEQGA